MGHADRRPFACHLGSSPRAISHGPWEPGSHLAGTLHVSFGGVGLVLPLAQVVACVPIPVGAELRHVARDAAHLSRVMSGVVQVVEPELPAWPSEAISYARHAVLLRDGWRRLALPADQVRTWVGPRETLLADVFAPPLRPATARGGETWLLVLREGSVRGLDAPAATRSKFRASEL